MPLCFLGCVLITDIFKSFQPRRFFTFKFDFFFVGVVWVQSNDEHGVGTVPCSVHLCRSLW
jgi:hypothetical protein